MKAAMAEGGCTRTWPNESEPDTNVNGGDKLRRPSQNSTQKQT